MIFLVEKNETPEQADVKLEDVEIEDDKAELDDFLNDPV